MAALSERLEAYQEAHTAWWDMCEKAPNADSASEIEALKQAIQKVETLLKSKTLYLGGAITKDLREAVSVARSMVAPIRLKLGTSPFEQARHNAKMKKMRKAGRTIEKEAGLPSFSQGPEDSNT